MYLSPYEYFRDLVEEGFEQRKLQAPAPVREYLVSLLQHYMDARNLFDHKEISESGEKPPQTLAELYLLAQQVEQQKKVELLRRLGDRALYMSGFFGDSLQRKIVDVDYYVQMGGTAYAQLSFVVREEPLNQVFGALSHRFVEFVDVLTVISHKSLSQSDVGLLRLYEQYIRTGSELAKERLLELGVVIPALDQAKAIKQS